MEKFPHGRKFLLGDGIQGLALDVLERLIEITYTEGKRAQIARRVGYAVENPAPGSR